MITPLLLNSDEIDFLESLEESDLESFLTSLPETKRSVAINQLASKYLSQNSSSETTLTIRLPKPLPHQMQPLNSMARFKVLVCGRRWGKTAMGLMMVLKGHGANGKFKGALNGGNIWWVAPSSTIYQEIWKELKRATRDAGRKNEETKSIELPGGGSVTVKSADRPDTLVGSGLDGVVLDEVGTMKEEAWNVSIRPALSDKRGWGVFIGTPKGFNWFYDLYQECEGRETWERWQRPSRDNPLLDDAEIEAARIEMKSSQAFSQEYLAQFTADGLGLFQRVWLTGPNNANIIPALPAAVTRVVRGWDNAGTEGGGDYTAGVLIGELSGVYYIIDVRRGQWSPSNRNRQQDLAAQEDNRRFPGMVTWVEEEGGSAGKESAEILKARMRVMGFLAKTERVTDPKGERARGLAGEAEFDNVRLVAGPWNREFIDELCIFPNGQHDDQADAASLAFNKLAKPQRKVLVA